MSIDYSKTTLIINTWSSQCDNCGKSAAPEELAHNTILGYGKENGQPGCGVKYTHVSSMYWDLLDKVAAMRPDLTLVKF